MGVRPAMYFYENRNLDGVDDLLIPIKVIGTTDEDIRNNITKSDKQPNVYKTRTVGSFIRFQKNLETYYSTYGENERLYYERRTGQYRLESIPKTKIVNIPQQIKSVSAMFLNNPHGVSGNYGAIVKKVGNKDF